RSRIVSAGLLSPDGPPPASRAIARYLADLVISAQSRSLFPLLLLLTESALTRLNALPNSSSKALAMPPRSSGDLHSSPLSRGLGTPRSLVIGAERKKIRILIGLRIHLRSSLFGLSFANVVPIVAMDGMWGL